MSRSSSSRSRYRYRAQTEPLAAIVAVAMLVVGIGIYAVALHGVLPGTSDRATADQTIDRVWDDVQQDGVFHAHDGADDLDDLVTGESLPAGATVSVRVTAIDEGEEQSVADAAFPSGYPDETTAGDVSELERYVTDEGVPADASVATRSIPVAVVSEAEIRSGTLRVAVW
ncbi:DUF7285 family protein [Natronoglomus mannanivorans]|uniref:Uncharacterized protein n=1 Tax=Natronoglomus mannanivorans TaxID=2979990 RepID=A0AAP3E0H0_9EURY|nr:hypothetical protein [Halobacteria archaeon AArc-xg1-1]